MTDSVTRRELLAVGGTLAMAGCLRLTDQSTKTATGGATDTNLAEQTETVTRTDEQTATGTRTDRRTETPTELNAAFTVTPETVEAGDEVHLDASPTTVPGGRSASYEWSVKDGPDGTLRPIGTDETTTHRFASSGAYQVGLAVTTADDESDRTEVTVSVGGDVTDVGDRLGFTWGELFVPSRDAEGDVADDRSLGFGCRRFELQADGETIAAYDIGTDPEPLLDRGVYGTEKDPEGDPYRWFGGPQAWTRLVFPDVDLTAATTLVIEGNIPPIDSQTVAVSVNETETDSLEITADYGVHRLSLEP